MALIRIEGLPAMEELEKEGWKILPPAEREKEGAVRIAVLNVMPLKEQTERHLLRRLAAAEAAVEVTFLTTETYRSTHVDPAHLEKFYRTISQVENEMWDGLIITGAPVEHMAFEEVAYWEELVRIMEWSKTHVRSVLHICWGAQAGLYYHYRVPKRELSEKQFGIYPHQVLLHCPLSAKMKSPFVAPHSRHTYTPKEAVTQVEDLKIVCESPMAGVYLMLDEARRFVFVTGHSEYEAGTLEQEYRRDLAKGLPIQLPYAYFPQDDDSQTPRCTWQEHSETLFNSWIQEYVKA